MINLKIIKINHLINVIILLSTIFVYKNVLSSENRIIFKIDKNVFTLLDLEKRIDYLDFVGSSNNINKELIIKDFISANLFYQYYKKSNNKNNYDNKIKEIYNNILETNTNNKKVYNYDIVEKDILDNIKVDYIRKIVLENILNSSINSINTSKEEIDLLYNLKIKYFNFKLKDITKLINQINNLDKNNYQNFQKLLNKNNIKFFFKEKEINNINKIDKRIRKNILSNKNFFIFEKEDNFSAIFIEKSFETQNGIIASLYSVKSNEDLDKEFLRCDNLINLKKYPNLINKDYKLIDLNNELKNKLVSVNDFVKYINDDGNFYVVLCNIKFDKEILNSINFNKLINLNVNEIESKFINKYSKIYNLKELHD